MERGVRHQARTVSDPTWADAVADAPVGGDVILDFDQTLFLSNSTELYLESARPRWLAALLLSALSLIKPWRWGARPGRWLDRDEAYRDWVRVAVLTVLLPWTRWRWRGQAAGVMRRWENAAVVGPLRDRPDLRVWVVSQGFTFIIAPLLRGGTLPVAGLIAGRTRDRMAIRREGKASAVERVIGPEALRGALSLSDSERDEALLRRSATGILIRWPNERSPRAFDGCYLPFKYTHRVKRHGRQELIRQILLDDLVLIYLAIGLGNLASFASAGQALAALVALTLAFVSFFCVYEIGYAENDAIAARQERRPKLTEGFSSYLRRPYMRGWSPWAWALVLSMLSVLCLHAYALNTPDIWPAAVVTLMGWLGVLLGTRWVFALYNRVNEPSRIHLFPLLQIAKTFGFLVLLPTTLAGALFMAAQVARRSLSYIVYRSGGHAEDVPNLVLRLWVYLLLGVAVVLGMHQWDLLTDWHFWVLAGWMTLRAASHWRLLARSWGWLRTEPPPSVSAPIIAPPSRPRQAYLPQPLPHAKALASRRQ